MDALFIRHPPTLWERFLSSPLLFLSRLLYYAPNSLKLTQSRFISSKIRVVCISDTHNTHLSQPSLPDGDILIHAGDLTVSGTQTELDNVLSWLDSQPHPHKIFIGGNHDTCLTQIPNVHHYISTKFPSLTYLQDSSTEIIINGRMLNFYGSPWTPRNGNWVFQYLSIHPPWYSPSQKPTSEYQSTQIWSRIPLLTDVLITHGPPFGHLDDNLHPNLPSASSGCYALLTRLRLVRPKLHVHGHIHVARGVERVRWDDAQWTYEEILAGRMGWIGVLRLFWRRLFYWVLRNGGDDGTTLMVNAASVGGLRDEKRLGAVVVEI